MKIFCSVNAYVKEALQTVRGQYRLDSPYVLSREYMFSQIAPRASLPSSFRHIAELVRFRIPSMLQ